MPTTVQWHQAPPLPQNMQRLYYGANSFDWHCGSTRFRVRGLALIVPPYVPQNTSFPNLLPAWLPQWRNLVDAAAPTIVLHDVEAQYTFIYPLLNNAGGVQCIEVDITGQTPGLVYSGYDTCLRDMLAVLDQLRYYRHFNLVQSFGWRPHDWAAQTGSQGSNTAFSATGAVPPFGNSQFGTAQFNTSHIATPLPPTVQPVSSLSGGHQPTQTTDASTSSSGLGWLLLIIIVAAALYWWQMQPHSTFSVQPTPIPLLLPTPIPMP